jgi:hypothetical protein
MMSFGVKERSMTKTSHVSRLAVIPVAILTTFCLGWQLTRSGPSSSGPDDKVSAQPAKKAKLADPVVREYWIALENVGAWDTAPNPNRMTGQNENQFQIQIIDPDRGRLLAGPTVPDALVYRRYKPPAAPGQDPFQPNNRDDRKVNPWDLNELSPSDPNYKGSIPGPILECNVGEPGVGETILVHFKNLDRRIKDPDDQTKDLPFPRRLHSLHTHGIVFQIEHDGAFPLSPIDKSQPIEKAEQDAWTKAYNGKTDAFLNPDDGKLYKRGDRVPPEGTFTYRWNTFGWPSTAGVWLYHDHSVDDSITNTLGSIGILIVHNPKDLDDVAYQLPDGTPAQDLPNGEINGSLKQNKDPTLFVNPPANALYLQLYHDMRPAVAINGRRFLGNTPTLIAGDNTKMRFGVVGMAASTLHTFHLHGHRWVLPGPSGGKVGGETPIGTGVQVSPLDRGVSQFEDTKVFSAANSFVFTIRHGTFMGPPLNPSTGARGEWHMHCHMLSHMDQGMMGSLLVIGPNQPFRDLSENDFPISVNRVRHIRPNP